MTGQMMIGDCARQGRLEDWRYRIRIKSRQPAVTVVVAEVESNLLRCGLDQDQTSETCLVLAEALNNVVEHAYRFADDGDIDVDLQMSRRKLTICISDFGPEFTIPDQTSNAPERRETMEMLPEGGFGWGLIHSLTDEIGLARVNNRNRLKLNKILA